MNWNQTPALSTTHHPLPTDPSKSSFWPAQWVRPHEETTTSPSHFGNTAPSCSGASVRVTLACDAATWLRSVERQIKISSREGLRPPACARGAQAPPAEESDSSPDECADIS